MYYVLCRVVFLCMNILRISLWPSDTGISAAAFHTVWSFGQETIFHIVLRIQPLTHIVQSLKGNHIFFLWWFNFLNIIACNSNDHSLTSGRKIIWFREYLNRLDNIVIVYENSTFQNMYISDVSNPNFFARLVKIVKNRKKSQEWVKMIANTKVSVFHSNNISR